MRAWRRPGNDRGGSDDGGFCRDMGDEDGFRWL